MYRPLLTLAVLILTTAPVVADTAKATGSYRSGTRTIGVTRFDPTGAGPHPAVVLLHGLEGADKNAAHYATVAQGLAGRGYVVFAVRYFDGLDAAELAFFQANAQPALIGNAKAGRTQVQATFAKCLAAVADGVRYACQQPGVAPERVGIVGFSLGGFLALSAAMQAELKITAVVELFGGLPDDRHAHARAMPVLILHGNRDTIVPVAQALALEKTLKAAGATPEVKVYDGVGHVFVGARGEFQWGAALDAQARAEGFLQRHLKP